MGMFSTTSTREVHSAGGGSLQDWRIAVEVSGIAAGPEPLQARAQALLEPLHQLLPYDGAWIAVLDDERRRHHTLARHGFDQRTVDYLDGPVLVDEIEELGMYRSQRALRVADFARPPEALRSWAECLLPAGFREGLGVCLFEPDGRHVGFLGLFTGDRTVPREPARELLARLAPLLARAVDPLRSPTAVARVVHDATSAVAVTRTGKVLPLPGAPGHILLRRGSAVVRAALELLAGAHTTFLAPDPSSAVGHVRVTALRAPNEAPHHLTAVLAVSPAGDLHGLTHRELEILGLLIAGWTNEHIAADLFIAGRTVATHVEHILTKLEAGNRALAAVRAQRQGLFVPPALLAHARDGPAARPGRG